MSIFWALLSPVGSFFLGAGAFLRDRLLVVGFLAVERLLAGEPALTRLVPVFFELVVLFFAVAIAQMFLCGPSITRPQAVCSRIMLT